MKANENYSVEIVGAAIDGRGIARVEGQVLFVPGALPGERCLVRVVNIGKTTAHGKLLRVEAASPHRIEPDCPYFPACGGCDFRHADYALETELKRQRVLDATGLTVSVGVSWCKAIAKLGSDYRKPNAVTVIDRARFADMVWPLPVSSLLFAGRSSVRQLERLGIRTVGALAAADADVLEQRLGKGGRLLHAYANGYDPAPVHRIADLPPPKSIGNSATAPRDLICEADARAALLSLAESVGARLRLEGYQCRTVELSVRTADLHWRSHRMALRHPSDLTSELLDAALALCEQAHLWPDPLRSIGIRALDLVPACAPHQLDLFEDAEHRARQRQLDITLDNLRARYGKTCVLRGRACFDPALGLVQREEHAFLRK